MASSQRASYSLKGTPASGPIPRPSRRLVWVGVVLGAGLWAAGCRSQSVYEAMEPAHYLSPKKDPGRLGRVVLVEFTNRSSYPEVSRDASEALYLALQKRQRFGLITVARTDPAWQALQIDPDGVLTPSQCEQIGKTFQCDGALVGILTEYRPFPHLVIGLWMRLVDLSDGQLVWAVEQVWDSGDRGTESRIKEYLEAETRSTRGSMADPLTVTSTLSFLKFVAYEVATTL